MGALLVIRKPSKIHEVFVQNQISTKIIKKCMYSDSYPCNSPKGPLKQGFKCLKSLMFFRTVLLFPEKKN